MRLLEIGDPARFRAYASRRQQCKREQNAEEQFFHAQRSIKAGRGASLRHSQRTAILQPASRSAVFLWSAYPRSRTVIRGLADVARDEFRHLEHAHLALAVKNRSEVIVGVDLRSLRLVLKTVLLDVVPKLFGELGTRQWF